jgi:hypothetical protein
VPTNLSGQAETVVVGTAHPTDFIITSDRRLIDPFAELFETLWCQFLE